MVNTNKAIFQQSSNHHGDDQTTNESGLEVLVIKLKKETAKSSDMVCGSLKFYGITARVVRYNKPRPKTPVHAMAQKEKKKKKNPNLLKASKEEGHIPPAR